MFDTLVVSDRKRRSNRTARFVLATSLVYFFAAGGAVALSIIVSNPGIADTNLSPTANLVIPITSSAQPEVKPAAHASQPAERADYNNPMPLDTLLTGNYISSPRTRITGPPEIGPVGDGANPNGVIGAVGAIAIPGAETHGDPSKDIGEPPKPQPTATTTKQRDAEPVKTVRVASTVLQGKAIERRTPVYPSLAKQANVEGSVPIEIIISPDGRVEAARAISGHALLKPAAQEAAAGWRFEPTLLGGTAVRVTGIITFNFKLRE
jgi:TonB family protein